MEIPRHWRLKKQRIGFTHLITNPVTLNGIQEAINLTAKKQSEELEPIRKLIRREESVNNLRPPVKLTKKFFTF